jgi:2-C-methyl-D-erythritol 2,4-cyclodiphosphate synthase
MGFDAHAFEAGRKLILGGVEIDHPDGLAGHSDADVLSHAIADALLGAARLGDLGDFFPADDRWKDASSIELLEHAAAAVRRGGWKPVNVDATLVAERPRLSGHRARMAENVAGAIGIGVGDVSIKATSTDGMGYVGRGEGMSALAVVLIERSH